MRQKRGVTDRLLDHGALKKENNKNMKLHEAPRTRSKDRSRSGHAGEKVLLDMLGSPSCDYHELHD